MKSIKKIIINKYYDFLMKLEDICHDIGTVVNNHRIKIDKKYWHKYLK